MPLALSDEELSHIMTACAPLAPQVRSAFLVEIADALARWPEIGPGAVHRAIVATQRANVIIEGCRGFQIVPRCSTATLGCEETI